MSTHNILFHYRLRELPQIFVSWSDRKNFIGTLKLVRMSHGKRAIGVVVFELLRFDCIYRSASED